MPRTAQEFGDEHTRKKLETVEKYLSVYTTALKNTPFKLLYVDACAGSGSSVPKATLEQPHPNQVLLDGFAPPVADTDAIIVGSAIRALGVSPPFHKYLLNDAKQSNVDALRKSVREDFPHLADRVELTRLDANEMLRSLCASQDWNETRAVVFLDPFGLQINYATLELLGHTKAVDVWYLVPVFAMYRQGDSAWLDYSPLHDTLNIGTTPFVALLVEVKGANSPAPSADEAAIRAARDAFNAAIAKGDLGGIAAVLADNAQIITGADSLMFNGKAAEMKLWSDDLAAPSRGLYVRTPDRIELSPVGPMALETGHWKGVDTKSASDWASGVYSAKWRRTGGKWLIESETYMTTACGGSYCPKAR